jgi:NADH/NAD ratio-sensing transcriptional regulator Rex
MQHQKNTSKASIKRVKMKPRIFKKLSASRTHLSVMGMLGVK